MEVENLSSNSVALISISDFIPLNDDPEHGKVKEFKGHIWHNQVYTNVSRLTKVCHKCKCRTLGRNTKLK